MSTALAAQLGLKHASDLRTLFLTASYFVLFAYLWLSAKAITAGGVFSLMFLAHIPLWLTLCYFSFLASVATHNCIHCPMFISRTANRGQPASSRSRSSRSRREKESIESQSGESGFLCDPAADASLFTLCLLCSPAFLSLRRQPSRSFSLWRTVTR